MSHKLDKVFNSNYKPMAVKNKSKSQEEEKQFKLADKVFADYSEQLHQVFNYFSKKAGNIENGRKDVTISIEDLIELLKTSNILG